MDFIKGLNPQQQQAVMAGLGPVLVLAGPGSGKTRVLTQRIAYLIGSMGVSPYHILAVTFTNKAAREMGSRVENLIGESARGLTLGTFHAVCARILRREADHLPFNANFVIFDSDDQLNLVKRAIRDLNLDEKAYRPVGVHAVISAAKNELILPDQFTSKDYRGERIKEVYQRYQELLLANNGLDFDDLLLWTAFLLEDHPDVREKYARRYEQVLVDEFQDTNMAQYNLLRHLASFHNNIFVVGDADQSIYRWRGADYRNVLRFEKDYPDTQVILLEQNYRSTQSILDVAMAVIDRNPQRTPKRLFTDRGTGPRVILREVEDDRVEAANVVDSIAEMVARKQARPGDFAVMYRTNAQSRMLEEAFITAGLPYKLVGAQRFYGRREIKDIIAFLRLVHNPNDEISLLRVINVPPRAIGEKTILALRVQAQKDGLQMGELLLEMGTQPDSRLFDLFPGRAGHALASFGSLLAKWISKKNDLPPLMLVDMILNDVDYQMYIDDGTEEGHDRWDNVMELRRVAAGHQDDGLEGMLEEIALVSDQDTVDAAASAPTLLTLHAAKGLEFPIVFIIGLNDGILPHSRSFDDREEMWEERRLLYVGITRAKDLLYLVYAQNRGTHGYSEAADPSRFLGDIPEELLQEESRQTRRRKSLGLGGTTITPKLERWGARAPAATAPAKPTELKFHPGMHVEHPQFGNGIVLMSRIDGPDEVVDVHFERVGLKRIIASMAKLEVRK